MDQVSFGQILKYYRIQNNLTQEELASGICSRKYIIRLEQNQQIPTLDIVNQLCNKLEINLYDTYALILRHHNIETHEKIEKLNQFFSREKGTQLKQLIDEYSKLDDFQYGEPYKILCYARCLYLGNVERNFQAARDIAYTVLSAEYPNFEMPNFIPVSLSNSDLSLLLSLATNYYRNGQSDESVLTYEIILRYLKSILSRSHYAVNKNHHFEMSLYGLVVYNLFITNKDFENNYEEELDFILNTLKTTENSFHLPELLFCKAYICKQKNCEADYESYYQMAYQIGKFLYDEQTLFNISNELFGKDI